MSNFLGLSGVSLTLRNLLEDRMEQPVDVTIAPPDVLVTGMGGRRVNLYLYSVSENGYLKNQDLAGRAHPAELGHPPLSLDLHYLLTAFGANPVNPDADLEAQQILADAMRVLHDFPLITENLHENDNPGDPLILDASLVGEAERIKVTLRATSFEEAAKLWSALPQSAFRRSVAYDVSVVQIESQRRRASALPVRRRQVVAVPADQPRLLEIRRDPLLPGAAEAVAEIGDTVLLLGEHLAGAETRVRLGPLVVPVPAAQARRIELVVPAALPAGAHSVQVIHDLLLPAELGQPPVAHRIWSSNPRPFLLLPSFVGVAPPAAGAGALVTVTVDPPAEAGQERSLLLGDVEIPGEPVAPDSLPTTNLAFRLPAGPQALPAGNYLLRVRVGSAESRLTFNPVTGAYDGPTFTVL